MDPGRGTGAVSGPLALALSAPLPNNPESTSKETRPGAEARSEMETGPDRGCERRGPEERRGATHRWNNNRQRSKNGVRTRSEGSDRPGNSRPTNDCEEGLRTARVRRPRTRAEPTGTDPGRGTGAVSGPLALALSPPLPNDPESTSKETRPGAEALSEMETGPDRGCERRGPEERRGATHRWNNNRQRYWGWGGPHRDWERGGGKTTDTPMRRPSSS
ncbi:hypothetical protein NDU88_003215 [Pleurodeles waltl]|uniref:Uncharacterized protein n=1 Tax=Pleurodeles waltl TaxID=8319 RepID=A0AAV7PBG8_PLEWA|nr:hypothetical protein NDU88_003215 [Pleurodeles waltl]